LRTSKNAFAVIPLLVLAAWAGACRPQESARAYEPIGKDAGALRAAFNADAGKVRVLMLVAPT
jgi:hypothetical protein